MRRNDVAPGQTRKRASRQHPLRAEPEAAANAELRHTSPPPLVAQEIDSGCASQDNAAPKPSWHPTTAEATPLLPIMLRLKEVAEHFDCGEHTIRRWIRKGLLSAGRIGAAYYVPQNAVNELIANQIAANALRCVRPRLSRDRPDAETSSSAPIKALNT